MTIKPWLILVLCFSTCSVALSHDTWVETNSNLVRTGDAVYVDLKLGNHGNHHRDFKLASKIDLDGCSLSVIDPAGKAYDLKDQLIDTGYAPNEGYWKGKFVAVKPGLYAVSHTLDKVVNHGHPVRSIKSGKTFFAVTPTLDRVTPDESGFDRVLGHPLELVPTVNPVSPMGPGQPISVRVMFKGKPMPEASVAFIPRGVTLAGEFDDQYERKSDTNGEATFTPRTGNVYLVVVHHTAKDESAADYDYTSYSATLTVFVPEICPCCGE
ncbi:MAG TPA: DUF4198 domain-containing protein [Planctomycetaceae bacterium]|nr:DUF4198 domain-containing protein [Planctomycetaceae bacterium]